MKESFATSKSIKERVRSLAQTAALAGALLGSHGEVKAFEIQSGSDFRMGMTEVHKGTITDKHESQAVLSVEDGKDGLPRLVWGGSRGSSWSAGGLDLDAKEISSILHGAVAETGAPFTVYNVHSHYVQLRIEGIDPTQKAYSVPPSAEDVITMLMHSKNEVRHGSRPVSVKYVAADGAGVWSFEKLPTDTVERTPFVISYELEGERGPLFDWIQANALSGDPDASTIEEHVRHLLSSEKFKSLVEAYQKVGVSVTYRLWSEVGPDDFPMAHDSAQ